MSQPTENRPEDGTDSVLQTTSDVTYSTKERYKQLADEFLLTPARIIWDDWRARVGITVLLSYLFMGVVLVYLTDPPAYAAGPRNIGPFQNLQFPLGTDSNGSGLFLKIVHATPPMLKMIFGGAIFSTSVATVVGTLSGFKGGYTDTVLMTITDVAMTIPGLPLMIVVVSLFQPESPVIIGILLSINAWAGLGRTIRSQVLTIREEPYVEASRTTGMSTRYILQKDIIPQLMPYISINFMNAARGVIFGSVGLYFIGLLPYSNENWGVMLNNAYSVSVLMHPGQWYTLAIPLVTIVLFSLGLILLAQGMDRIFNPRIRARHSETTDDAEGEVEASSGSGTGSSGGGVV